MKNKKLSKAWRYSRNKLIDAGSVALAFLIMFFAGWGLLEIFPNVLFFGLAVLCSAVFAPFVIFFFLCRFAYYYLRGYFHK